MRNIYVYRKPLYLSDNIPLHTQCRNQRIFYRQAPPSMNCENCLHCLLPDFVSAKLWLQNENCKYSCNKNCINRIYTIFIHYLCICICITQPDQLKPKGKVFIIADIAGAYLSGHLHATVRSGRSICGRYMQPASRTAVRRMHRHGGGKQ